MEIEYRDVVTMYRHFMDKVFNALATGVDVDTVNNAARLGRLYAERGYGRTALQGAFRPGLGSGEEMRYRRAIAVAAYLWRTTARDYRAQNAA